MIRNEERMRVLKMVADGKITAEQATSLLETLDDGPAAAGRAQSIPTAPQVGRYFRVRVTDKITGRVRVNVRLPVGVINAGLKLGMRFAPQVEGIDYQAVAELIRSGGVGKIVDVEDEEDSERVEIYIE